MKTETVHGIEYSRPTVVLMQETGIGTSELAARTCYDSFENSENQSVTMFKLAELTNGPLADLSKEVNDIEHSSLLDTLAWTHFHHSILEHANLTYLIKGTSRAVLQEHARHRLQAISVRSTRYTMSSVINAFIASLALALESNSLRTEGSDQWFLQTVTKMDLFITTNPFYNRQEIEAINNKLHYQLSILGYDEFTKISVAKSSLMYLNKAEYFKVDPDHLFEWLQNGKKKRNVGDAFKHIISDNWKVDMVVTFNLRSLKNYFTLRDSGAAYFQIKWLAEEMKKVTPQKYLDLIIKGK